MEKYAGVSRGSLKSLTILNLLDHLKCNAYGNYVCLNVHGVFENVLLCAAKNHTVIMLIKALLLSKLRTISEQKMYALPA